MRIVITDLDGTLLDHQSYSFHSAEPALAELKRRCVPLVLCTSKTRAETEQWQNVLQIRHPFIVENGGALCIPPAYFSFDTPETIPMGAPYVELTAALREASRLSDCRVRGFDEMSVAEVAVECGLSLAEASLAKQREFDEPFLILSPERADALLHAIEGLGRRYTRGGRFFHITGDNDKACAVQVLASLFVREADHVETIGLGDGINDAGFLNDVDHAVLMRSPRLAVLQSLVPAGVATQAEGPQGWNDAVLAWLQMVI
jgi:mannosyl-3-phosphoglycerate phosphatase family protein